MNFIYTTYARRRLQERYISEAWVEEIIVHGVRYRDTLSGREVAVGRRQYLGKERDVMVAFERKGDTIVIVTSSALKESQRERRIQTGRWVPL
ncbi:MAG: DUF4258 domain-containing protein [Candidatus Bipolaricaulota bacterium]|nr:DUF4258 domain-containing protein [Candidatus Bipolaricaulota bacterium]MCS7274935.1 DUF4258 domain-containing protein [Candidatus Bipolaricaulota bacterium]MDW8110550.1 DUF4258 domain-containing protein [Candidatus Bipolaricaulota bacterium]MDW8329816.1 DUF4258 domain-containing protein [Candidatus Bipolaricaulota bacterium]